MTLSELKIGEKGVIADVVGSDGIAARLLEMGLLPGETIEVIGRAPMGDPTEYSVVGYRISLRKVESARVQVDKAS
ncbi:MAG: ferrous iron transport protein A [Planctomycetes bacterium]|nr:ferrous iron transport protein A [Planctomycetota bacterium]